LAPIIALALVASGFAGPDAWAERLARRRRTAMVAALPDALDLVAVGAATGRTPVAMFEEIATGTAGPLASELALVIAEIQAGARQSEALAALRERTGVPELGSVGAALERSRRYGSPLAEQLHAQAATLRAEEQRRIEERAARAAPKIQLVVAMVLVPSALLAIAAALVAHSDALFASF
jgi:tight adherence protein C